MKIPLSWLKEFIAIEQSPQKIADILNSLGLEVDALHEENQDHIFEIALTPNLAHAASVLGIARELSSFTNVPITYPPITMEQKPKESIDVVIENEEGCPKYAAIILEVKNQPSPAWLQKRLESCSLRPINCVVDVTNYVLHEMGHPLHAFDLDKIQGKIVVRRGKKGETITTLDGKEHFLTEEMLLIADEKGPLAIAGVMGGQRAEVDEGTKKIVIEAAYFDPKSIRRTSKKLSIHTEASYHFERGTDPHILQTALQRAAHLLQEMAQGKAVSKIIENVKSQFPLRVITCRRSRVNQILGTKLSFSEIVTIFKRIGCEIKESKDDTITAVIPSYRNDLIQEIDLIEEVARFYGYDNIYQKGENVYYTASKIQPNPLYEYEEEVTQKMLSEGLQELLSCNLISLDEAHLVSPSIFPSRSLVKIVNPTSAAHAVLRPSMLPGALQIAKENFNHNLFSWAGFEIGKIHFEIKGKFFEPTTLAIVLTGKNRPYHWERKAVDFDFFDLKGMVENFFKGMKMNNLSFAPSQFENFHPKRQLSIMKENDQLIGILGELHPQFLRDNGISQPLYFSELNLDELFPLVSKEVKYVPVPSYPASTRDLTLSVKKESYVQKMVALIQSVGSKILEEVLLLDVYESKNLGSDIKNVTLRFIYRDSHKTISFEEVEKEHERIIKTLKSNGWL